MVQWSKTLATNLIEVTGFCWLIVRPREGVNPATSTFRVRETHVRIGSSSEYFFAFGGLFRQGWGVEGEGVVGCEEGAEGV